MEKPINTDFFDEFVDDILLEAGLEKSESEAYKKIHQSLMNRVQARMLLATINELSPEQAVELKNNMENGGQGLEAISAVLASSHDSKTKILFSLAQIRDELVADVTAMGQE